jgi:hypothetical protein
VRADVKQVRAIAVVDAASWDPAALRRELNDRDIGPILEESEPGQHPVGKTSPTAAPHRKAIGSNENTHCEERHTRMPLGLPTDDQK